MLQRSGLFANGAPGITIGRARTADEFKAAYRLVHDVYVERGYCREKDWGMRLRIYEASAQMATFIAKDTDDSVVGVLSVVGDCEPFGLPSEDAFGEEIANIRRDSVKLCEVTNQAVTPSYRKTAVPTELMRCAMAHGVVAGYQRAIATVSPGHTGFYNLLNFFSIGPVKSYSTVLHDPVVALCGDLDFYRSAPGGDDAVSGFIHQYMTAGNPYVRLVKQWSIEAPCRFLNAALLRSLFAPSFLDECTDPEIKFIGEQWGWNLFDRVTEPNAALASDPGPQSADSDIASQGRRDFSECWPAALAGCPGADR